MNVGKVAECESVDLTEDDNSLGENPEYEHPIHFVNCSGSLYPLLNASQGDTPAQFLKNATVSSFTEHPKEATTPRVDDSGNEFLNHVSSTLLQDNSQVPKQVVPQSGSIYSPQQPPGKVVIIKKNNKYYKIIIPHNVMPNITESIGSVLINIPEVGPLVISNDPQAAKVKPSQLKQQQLSLNLDAIQQNEGCTSITRPEKPRRAERRPPKKFCWCTWRVRKRDLEGFTVYDRLGFNKTEGLEAKKCMHRANSIIRDLETRLKKKKQEYEEFKRSVRNKNKVKLVKINKILKTNQIDTSTINLEPDETDDYGSDLLVTKKVVILNQNINEPEIKRKSNFRNKKIDRRKRRYRVKDEARRAKGVNLEKLNKNIKIKPCLVHLVKNKQVEEAYVKYCADMGLNVKQKPLVQRPRKKLSGNKMNNDLDKLFVKKRLKHTKLFDNTLFKSVIIKSEQKLIDAVNRFKPFLILTDRTIGEDFKYYCNEFVKNNIIYITHSEKGLRRSLVKHKGFVCAIEIGYVKLVDSNLFSKFVANGMKFPGMDKNRDEHNYSLPKHLQA